MSWEASYTNPREKSASDDTKNTDVDGRQAINGVQRSCRYGAADESAAGGG